jgi:putative ABC transport system ATP-binding protein
MQIVLDNALPIPLADTPLAPDSCWKKRTEINAAKRYLVEAPSGTGKTTLVSMIYGIRHDYNGTISFDGKDIRTLSAEAWAVLRRETFSAVFQDLRLFPQLSALQNIRIKNDLKNTLSDDAIKTMAEQLGIGHRMDQPCGKLSLGQQQRVAIIRALAQPFRFLLLDEPFSHLDEENTKKARLMIAETCAKNSAGLLLTSLAPVQLFDFHESIII